MTPEIPPLSPFERRHRGETPAARIPKSGFATRLSVLKHLRTDQLVFLLLLVVGASLLNLAPAVLALTVGLLAVTVGLLGIIPLLLARILPAE